MTSKVLFSIALALVFFVACEQPAEGNKQRQRDGQERVKAENSEDVLQLMIRQLQNKSVELSEEQLAATRDLMKENGLDGDYSSEEIVMVRKSIRSIIFKDILTEDQIRDFKDGKDKRKSKRKRRKKKDARDEQ